VEECGPCPVFASFTPVFALQGKKNLSQVKKNLSQGKKNLSQVKRNLSRGKKNLSQVKKNLSG